MKKEILGWLLFVFVATILIMMAWLGSGCSKHNPVKTEEASPDTSFTIINPDYTWTEE